MFWKQNNQKIFDPTRSPVIGKFSNSFIYEMDPFDADTRRYVFERLRQGYIAHSISQFWLNSDESDLGERNPQSWSRSSRVFAAGPAKHVSLAYPKFEQQMVFEGLQGGEAPQGEVISLARSAFLGSQRYGTLLWSGDIHST
jgi:alpha-D-xyloside xylohydrolase